MALAVFIDIFFIAPSKSFWAAHNLQGVLEISAVQGAPKM